MSSQIYQTLRPHISEYDANWTKNLNERVMEFLNDLKKFFTNCAKCWVARNDQFQLESNVHINYKVYEKFISNLTENTFRFHYEDQSVNAVKGEIVVCWRIVRNTQIRVVAKDRNF